MVNGGPDPLLGAWLRVATSRGYRGGSLIESGNPRCQRPSTACSLEGDGYSGKVAVTGIGIEGLKRV
jgi:hypothetical protein